MHIFFGENMISYRNLRQNLEKMFSEAGIDDFADIDWIACEILNTKRSMLPFCEKIDDNQLELIMEDVQKRLNHIPVAYIFGKTNFYGYDLVVNENVLIPRLDTEILIEETIKLIKTKKPTTILDIGTGSGAISIVLNKETGVKTIAVDVSEKALDVAKQNAKLNNADIQFIQSDIFENIADLKVDFIISNPPYIETEVVKGLEKEVVQNEPILALDGGIDGLNFYKRIINEAKSHLNPNGMLIFEIGYNQADAVTSLLEKDFKDIKVIKDYGGNNRVVIGELIWLKD